MQWLQFGFMIRDLSLEFYLGVVAVVFTAIGIWAGLKLTQPKTKVVLQSDFSFNEAECNWLGISKRELEVLQLMAKGFSEEDALTLTNIYKKNEKFWVDFLMSYELKMTDPTDEKPLLTGTVTFLSFVIFGCIPLIPFVIFGAFVCQ